MDTTPNLGLPYLAAAQSQKHVTHNEAIRALDALVQLSAISRVAATPPSAPAEGARYIVAASASGAWSGHGLSVAAFQDGAWAFFVPRAGWLVYVVDEAKLVVFDGTAWTLTTGGLSSTNPVALVGVNATADATNRLAVKSPASLFDNVGNGHQLKLNKAAASDTVSLLFQDAYSGRAEIGLTGDDSLHVKVSSNGTAWKDAMLIDPASGSVSFPSGTRYQFWAEGLDPTLKCTIANSMFLAAEGDSLTSGQSAVPGAWASTSGIAYADLYAASNTSGAIGYVNVSQGGSKLTDLQTRASALDAQLAAHPGYANTCLSVYIGRNDGAYPASPGLSYPGGQSALPDWQVQLKAYLTARRAAGWQRIVVCTITPYNTEKTVADATSRVTANAFLRSLVASGHANGIADFAADPIMGNPASMNPVAGTEGPPSLFFHDYVHQSAYGHAREMLIAAPIYNAQAVNAVASAAVPVFGPAPGTYETAQSVTLTSATAGATIYYTTNGTVPTTSSTVYGAAIPVASTTTLNAIAVKAGLANSPVAAATYTIASVVATPTFAPSAGSYAGAQSVAITVATAGATIAYTIDGSTPTSASTVYSAPLTVATSLTVKAVAFKAGSTTSAVASAAYTITTQAAAPTFSPAAGTFSTAQSITLSSTTPSAVIYYTLDGSTPTTSSPVYAATISIAATATLKAIAVASGYTTSAVASAAYTIGTAASFAWSAVETAGQGTLDATKHILTPTTGNNSNRIRMGSASITGKVVAELLFNGLAGAGGAYQWVGLVRTATAATADCNSAVTGYVLASAYNQMTADGTNGHIVQGGNAWPRPLVDGQRVMLAIDVPAGKVWYSFNGGTTWGRSGGSPAAGTGPDFTIDTAGSWWPAVTVYQGTTQGQVITLPATIAGALPAGFTALNA